MFKVFVEYAIKPEYRNSYLIYMHEWQSREGRLELLEGTDQEGLFVEIWNGVSYKEYEALKQERINAANPSNEYASWELWIQGGIPKLHMWHFTQVKA